MARAKKTRTPVMTAPVRYDFTPEEQFELGEKLAAAAEKLEQLTRNKKAVMVELNAAIKQAAEEHLSLWIKKRQGYEMRDEEVTVQLHQPKRGMAQVIVVATGEVLETRPMTPAELQDSFEFEPSTEARPS